MKLTDDGLYMDFLQELNELIYTENRKQINKWGKQCHDIHKWLTIVHEEIGEIDKAILELEHNYMIDDCDTSTFKKNQIKKEIIQTLTLYIKLYKMVNEQC